MEETKRISPLKKLIDRVGNPLEWSTIDKCLLIICFWLLVGPLTTLLFHYFNNHPESVPFFDLVFMKKVLPLGWILGVVWSILLVVGLLLRHRSLENRAFAYVTVFLWWSEEAFAAVCAGPLTTPAAMMLLGQGFVAFLLFEIPVVLVSLSFALLLVVGSTVATQYGLFPYAPLMAAPLYEDGRIANSWVLLMGPAYLIIYLGFLSLSAYIITRWRDREARLADLTIMLKKMFGRYLSTEVMNSLIENPSALELGGEKRKVTVMMTDLRGFTAIAERLEPEKVVQMLNVYFEIMVDVVLKYNGTINEIIGDALLIIFGAPQEMPDRIQRAIACSIDMQNAMTQVNKENRSKALPELEMGIGLNETEVIIGNIGSSKRSKYTVIGSGVNMASRIESYTVGGQILISESVRKQAGEVLRIDSQQNVFPKGSEIPLMIYEVGGIAGSYNLILEGKDSALVTLALQIPIRCTVVEGKHVGGERLQGKVIRLSTKSIEIALDEQIELLTNLKMDLGDVGDGLPGNDFYGKVIKQLGKDGYTHSVRFTSIPPEIVAYFQALHKYAARPSPKNLSE
ncbi:MAG: adenylate/guanylate cyclase domain-containing protein [Desulfobacula sp.]|uniref:adenylate/guanylate cyclase domain-containing protein n=4 Tax=Desulfobacula sp. TaxID=2593537 RepID=UPI001ED50D0B|nr:adenylate/guanylate cyclase domain-containing protein [Desulfobacula sp.]